MYEIIARSNIPVITRFKLNTCEPYIIKYPIPSLDTNNSPMIIPIKHILIFIFNELIIISKFPLKISILYICHLVAFKLFISFILLLSVLINPFNIVIMLIIDDIKSAINIMELVFAPIHIIKIGPSATLGRLFNIVKYGSNTLHKNLFHHNTLATIIPIIIDKVKLINVSYNVTHI